MSARRTDFGRSGSSSAPTGPITSHHRPPGIPRAHSVMKCRSRSSPSWRCETKHYTLQNDESLFWGMPKYFGFDCKNLMECFYLLWGCYIICSEYSDYAFGLEHVQLELEITGGTAEVSRSLDTEDWHIWEEQTPQNQPPVNKIHQDVETQYSVYN